MAHQMKNAKNGGSPNNNLAVEEAPQSPTTVVLTPSPGMNNNAPKYGTVVPNRIFVGGISPTTTELDLNQLFSSAYGRVTATKIIQDRAGVSKGYGFVTFETEEEAKRVLNDSDNIVLKERRLNIAPAVKKQAFSRGVENGAVVVGQPAQVFQQNGVSFSYHNGMAFFNSNHPQQAIDPAIYQSYAAATPQVAQFAPVVYSTQMYYQGPPQQYPPPQYQIPYGGVGEGVYEGGGGEMYGGGGAYPSETTTAACYPVQAYPLHEYRRILALPPPTHFYEPHYIEHGEGGGLQAKPDSTADLPSEKTPVVSLSKLKEEGSGGWGKKCGGGGGNRRSVNNNNPMAANRNLPLLKSPPPAPYSPMVRPFPPPPQAQAVAPAQPLPHHANPRSRPPLQVPQFPYYQQTVVPAPRGYLPSPAATPAQPPPPQRRSSANHHQRRNNSGRRGRGSRSGSSGGGGGEPLTPPTTPRSSPPPHHQSTPVQQQITSSVQALTI